MLQEFRTQKIVWTHANQKLGNLIVKSGDIYKGRRLLVQVKNRDKIEELTGCRLFLMCGNVEDEFTLLDSSQGLFELFYTNAILAENVVIKASLVLKNDTSVIESSSIRIEVI